MSQEVASTHDLTWMENELLLYSVSEIWGRCLNIALCLILKNHNKNSVSLSFDLAVRKLCIHSSNYLDTILIELAVKLTYLYRDISEFNSLFLCTAFYLVEACILSNISSHLIVFKYISAW